MELEKENLENLVIRIIQVLKKGPFTKVVPLYIMDFVSKNNIEDEKLQQEEAERFNVLIEQLINLFEVKLENEIDLSIIYEQYQKINDSLTMLKQNKLISDSGWNFEVDQKDYQKRIELLQIFKELALKRINQLGGVNKIASVINNENIEFNIEGLTKELNVAGLKVKMSGADLAFYLQVFRNVGWLSGYEDKILDKVFSRILNENINVFFGGEYILLRNFEEKLSRAKSYSDMANINEKRKKEFQDVLKATIKKAQETFLDNDEAFKIYGT